MPKNNDVRKYNYNSNPGRIYSMENNSYFQNSKNMENENGNGSLIIDDNTIYEIDDECVERIRKSRTSQRYNRNK